MKRRVFAAILLLALLAACTNEPETRRRQFFALGTLVDITVVAPREQAEPALHDAEQELLALEHRWRAWDDGELAELNRRLAAGDAVTVEPEMLAGIRKAETLWSESDGLFNPAIGRLVELWGFNHEERPDLPPPSNADIDNWLRQSPSPEDLDIAADGSLRSGNAALWLDMGAFAKGLAVERAIEILRRHGIENAIVNAGGDLKTLGRHGERDWNIGVRDPRGPGILAALRIHGPVAVFTSGDYERYFMWQGKRYHHLLDPRTGRPADATTSLTVLTDDAARGDAAATALFVAGDDWPAVAKRMGIPAVLRVAASGKVQMTPAMQDILEWEDRVPDFEIIEP